MRLHRVLRFLLRRGAIILLTVLITVGSTAAVTSLQTSVYRSTIILNLWPARLDLSLQQTIKGLMRSFASTIQSRDTALRVVNDLELDITPEQLLAILSVTPSETDYMIEIAADDYDPLIARDIAQRTAEVFVQAIKVQMVEQDKSDQVEVTILDDALIGTLHEPRWDINLVSSVIFGLLLGTLVVLLVARSEASRVRNRSDLESKVGVAVIGVVPMVQEDGRHR